MDGDYHLKSKSGRWDGKSQEWIYDNLTSPCIDAADPQADLGSELYPHGTRLNMGAYGGTLEASMSSSRAGNIADMNNDNYVDMLDFLILTDSWMLAQKPLREDINRNGYVGIEDLAAMVQEWLSSSYVVIYQNTMDTDMGWTAEGQLEFGQPLGLGGVSYGNPDPDSGYTGTNVYGINLSGDYDTALGERHKG